MCLMHMSEAKLNRSYVHIGMVFHQLSPVFVPNTFGYLDLLELDLPSLSK